MGLRPHEERILGQIERTLSACDPKLAEVLSTFTRLTAHERIPAEGRPLTVPAGRNGAALRAASRPGLMSPRGMPGRNSRILQVVLVMAAAALFAVCLITLSGTGGSSEVSPAACTMAWTYVPPCPAGGFSDQVHHPTGPDKNRTLNRLTIGSSPGGLPDAAEEHRHRAGAQSAARRPEADRTRQHRLPGT